MSKVDVLSKLLSAIFISRSNLKKFEKWNLNLLPELFQELKSLRSSTKKNMAQRKNLPGNINMTLWKMKSSLSDRMYYKDYTYILLYYKYVCVD